MPEKKVYIETYGCQMNLNDTEIASAFLKTAGFRTIDSPESADAILLNTCSVRENAERKIFERLKHLRADKKRNKKLVVGILGCMAERLKDKLFEESELVDFAVGPDEYRKLPQIVDNAEFGVRSVATDLSLVETYDDAEPLRKSGISAWLSIMRGCDNFCSYCVVPHTRGRERSRPFDSLVRETEKLAAEGFKEIVMLGQNVNSYRGDGGEDFADLLDRCAESASGVRFRFTTSHPKDLSDKLIETIARRKNVCNHLHLALQSGSNRILKAMNRRYTIEKFIERIESLKIAVPDCAVTTDLIAGFPGETLEDHELALDALKEIRFDGAFMFKYSPREGTRAFDMEDDVPEEEKLRRLNEIVALQNSISKENNLAEIGKIRTILVEGPSKRDPEDFQGRTDQNKIAIFHNSDGSAKPGDFVDIRILRSTSATLFGEKV